MTPDMINGTFELVGSCFLILNVIKLHKDKVLQGVHYLPTVFFTLWGMWNLFYFPHLEQWFSFFGGILLATVNTVWLIQIWYYYRKNKTTL